MAYRKTNIVTGEFYHLYNRGNSKQLIYHSSDDYERFMALLYLSNSSKPWEIRELKHNQIYEFERGEQHVAIGAYCLMPNHFHILLTPLTETGVSSFMRKLATGYSMYFNEKFHRTGSLFEGRYKSQQAANDQYLKYLFAYIHLNPVKLLQSNWREVGLSNVHEAQNYLNTYQYSSFIDSKVKRPQSAILNREFYPPYFETHSEINNELLEWLSYPVS